MIVIIILLFILIILILLFIKKYEYFKKKYSNEFCYPIEYNRDFKSYHDKIRLVKEILKHHNIAIIFDADVIIKNNLLNNL